MYCANVELFSPPPPFNLSARFLLLFFPLALARREPAEQSSPQLSGYLHFADFLPSSLGRF